MNTWKRHTGEGLEGQGPLGARGREGRLSGKATGTWHPRSVLGLHTRAPPPGIRQNCRLPERRGVHTEHTPRGRCRHGEPPLPFLESVVSARERFAGQVCPGRPFEGRRQACSPTSSLGTSQSGRRRQLVNTGSSVTREERTEIPETGLHANRTSSDSLAPAVNLTVLVCIHSRRPWLGRPEVSGLRLLPGRCGSPPVPDEDREREM